MPRIFVLVIVGLILLGCDQADSANDASHTNTAAPAAGSLPAPGKIDRTITMYKSATCGCCVKWADHLEENGFRVVLHDTEELGVIKRKFSVPADMRSCHTATIGEYVIEGHVPASDIEELLEQRPPQKLLTVPGMPLGSPGMEHPNGSMPYDSLLVTKDGDVTVFKHHAADP